MKRIWNFLARVLFAAFMGLIMLLTVTLSFGASGDLSGGNLLIQFGGLALFDGGALAWFVAFIVLSGNTTQRGVSLAMTALDVIGTLAIAGMALVLDQPFFEFDLGMIGLLLFIVVILYTALNVGGVYVFHMSSNDVRGAVELADAADVITDKAMELTKAMALQQLDGLAEKKAKQLMATVEATLEQRIQQLTGYANVEDNKSGKFPKQLEGRARDIPTGGQPNFGFANDTVRVPKPPQPPSDEAPTQPFRVPAGVPLGEAPKPKFSSAPPPPPPPGEGEFTVEAIYPEGPTKVVYSGPEAPQDLGSLFGRAGKSALKLVLKQGGKTVKVLPRKPKDPESPF